MDITIKSPVDGFIDKIEHKNGYHNIFIYIPRDSPHLIYIPTNGYLNPPLMINGIIEDPVFRQKENTHNAQIIWSIVPDNDTDSLIKFNIQVGKPQFITDRIRIDLESNEKYKMGEQLGEILIGSRAIVSIPESYVLNEKLRVHQVKSAEELEYLRKNKGGVDDIVGGKTVLATYDKKRKVYKLVTK